jgi:hypothetical protein
MYVFCILYFETQYEQFIFNCTAIPLHFHIVTATIQTPIISRDAVLSFLLTKVHVFCYQPSWHNYLHFAILFKFMAARILLRLSKHRLNTRRQISPIHNRCRFLNYESISKENLFSDWLSYFDVTSTNIHINNTKLYLFSLIIQIGHCEGLVNCFSPCAFRHSHQFDT